MKLPEELSFKQNLSLAEFTTLGVGGKAKYFVEVDTEKKLLRAMSWVKANKVQVFVLGGGSNVVVSGLGFNGLVIKMSNRGIKKLENNTSKLVVLEVAAGEIWDDFVAYAVRNNLAGIECLSGIPGSVGASPVQNIGAYGQEVEKVILKVRFLDINSLEIKEYSNKQCHFSYRNSFFKKSKNEIIISVFFRLHKGGEPNLEYSDLKAVFVDQSPTLSQVRDTVIKIRKEKSTFFNKDDPSSISVGSFFINPVISRREFQELKGEIPHYLSDKGIKIPAAWLIEKAGFSKGYSAGNVGLSQKHALIIINKGGATAKEIIGFAKRIKDKVFKKFGISLIPEPTLVGFSKNAVF